MPTTARRTRRLGALAMGLSLAGCAINPVVEWAGPQEPPGATTLDTMEGARAYARAYKDALHAKARDYVGAQVRLDDNLLALGLFTTAALVYKAPRDVSLGLAGLFGASYLAGQQNLGKTRLDVYQTGIGATNCALAAVAPLNFSSGELREVTRESDLLARRELPTLAWWLSAARMSFAASTIRDEEQKAAINAQLQGAARTYQSGLDLLNDTSQLPGRVSAAAAGLKGTVDTISAQVDKLASSTVVDPATIARSLGGLAGIVGSVAPGAGLDATFTSRINPAGAGAGGAPSLAGANPRTLRSIIGGEPGLAPDADAEARLGDALANLASAQARVDGKVKSLGGRIAASKTFGIGATEALKACGLTVSDAIVTFRVADPPLPIVIRASATDAVTQEIRAAGGVKNYAGHLSRGSGVELVPPPAGASNFVVKVPKDAARAGDLDIELTLEDSSGQVVKVPVKVQKP